MAYTEMKYLQIAKGVIQNEITALQALESEIEDTDFNDVIEKILSITGRVICVGIGKSGHIARKIAASLASTGTAAFFVHPSEASHGDLGMIAANDVVIMISNSGETKELFDVIHYCQKKNIAIIAITKNKQSTLGIASSYLITLPKHKEASSLSAPTTSSLLTLAIGDALTVALHEAKNITKASYLSYHPGGKIGENLRK